MSRRLVLLRHGRTAWNHEGRIQGHSDVGLDEVGHEQAARTAPAIAALEPSVVWCSDLMRTRETVAPLAEATGLPITFDARLREFGFGPYESLSHVELEAVDPEGYRALRRGDYDTIKHAEPTVEVRKRMADALADLVARIGPGETAVAVSHGAAIRVVTGELLGWPDEQFRSLRGLDNGGWVVLLEDPDGSRWRLQAYNRVVPGP